MTTMYNPRRGTISVGSLMLANFATMWGTVLAPIYLVGFGLLLPNALDSARGAGAVTVLPLELPLIGLILGLVGLSLSRCSGRPWSLACVLGVVLNAIPTALAAALWALRVGPGLAPWLF